MSTLTIDHIKAAAALLRGAPDRPRGFVHRLDATAIIFDQNCLEATDERLFPESKHRSKRIRKKLLKRHGGEFRKVPCMFRIGNRIVAHPSYRALLEGATIKD